MQERYERWEGNPRGGSRDDARRRGRQQSSSRNDRARPFGARDEERFGDRFEQRYDEIDPMHFGDDDSFYRDRDRDREPIFDADRNRSELGSSNRQRRDDLERDPYRYGEAEWRERYSREPWQQPLYAGSGEQRYGQQQPRFGQPTNYGDQDFAHHGLGTGGLQQGYGSQQHGPGSQPEWRRGSGGAPERGRHAGKGPKGYQRSDERVIDDVCQALERDPDVDASEIEVSCQKGEIVLKGSVESREAKRCAEECVEDLPGVKDVRNELRVQRQGAAFEERGAAARNPH